MAQCEVCEIRENLHTCAFDDQSMLDFCAAHWIEHVKAAHKDNEYAQEMARAMERGEVASMAGALTRHPLRDNWLRDMGLSPDIDFNVL